MASEGGGADLKLGTESPPDTENSLPPSPSAPARSSEKAKDGGFRMAEVSMLLLVEEDIGEKRRNKEKTNASTEGRTHARTHARLRHETDGIVLPNDVKCVYLRSFLTDARPPARNHRHLHLPRPMAGTPSDPRSIIPSRTRHGKIPWLSLTA
ncbi:hypothetical protein BHM03_00040115 [Ensete ventricosum]|nr:hypothetical protein BHM03_00040115 [Ensete ventricosum]